MSVPKGHPDLDRPGEAAAVPGVFLTVHLCVVGRLARLVEECEREGDTSMRTRALDAWDRLILSWPSEVGPIIRELTA